MGEVVYLPGAKKREVDSTTPKYFCTHCTQDLFRLLEDGTVWCNSCGRKINNLRLADDSPQ